MPLLLCLAYEGFDYSFLKAILKHLEAITLLSGLLIPDFIFFHFNQFHSGTGDFEGLLAVYTPAQMKKKQRASLAAIRQALFQLKP